MQGDLQHAAEFGHCSGRWFLQRALAWAAGLDEFDTEIALITPLVDRPDTPGHPHEVEVSPAERAALRVLLGEAAAYWEACDYAADEGEDGILGMYAEGLWSVFVSCFRSPEDMHWAEVDL